jgi:hypothetical protein
VECLEERLLLTSIASVADAPAQNLVTYAVVGNDFGNNLFEHDAAKNWIGRDNNPVDHKISAGRDVNGNPMVAYLTQRVSYASGFGKVFGQEDHILDEWKIFTSASGSASFLQFPLGTNVQDVQAGRNGSVIARDSSGKVVLFQAPTQSPPGTPSFITQTVWTGGAGDATVGTDWLGRTVVYIVSNHQLFQWNRDLDTTVSIDLGMGFKRIFASENSRAFVWGQDGALYLFDLSDPSNPTQTQLFGGVSAIKSHGVGGVVFTVEKTGNTLVYDLATNRIRGLTIKPDVIDCAGEVRSYGNPEGGFLDVAIKNSRNVFDPKIDKIFEFDIVNNVWSEIGDAVPNQGVLQPSTGMSCSGLAADTGDQPPLPKYAAPTPALPQDLVFNLDQGPTTNDTIYLETVTASDGTVGAWVGLNGSYDSYYSNVSSITVNAGSGDDTIDVESLAASVPLTINLGSGNDAIHFSPLAHKMDNVLGGVVINRGSGTGTVTVDDDNTADESTVFGGSGTQLFHHNVTYSISDGDLWRLDQLGTAFDPSGSSLNTHIQFAGISNFVVNGAPSNVFNVFGVADGTRLAVNGYDGRGRLNFDDSGNSFANGAAYTITGSNVTRVGAGSDSFSGGTISRPRFTASIDYSNMNDLEVQAGPSANAINVQSTNPFTATTIDAGMTSDIIMVSDAAQTFDSMGGLILINGNQHTTLNLDDSGNSNNNNYWLTGFSLSRTYAAPLFFSGTRNINIYGGSGSEIYHVGTTLNGPIPAPAWVAPNGSIALYTTGTQADRISVVDAFYADADGNLRYTLDGLSGLGIFGHAADKLVVDNTATFPLPAGTTLYPQSFMVTADAVTMSYSGQTSGSGSTTGFFGVAAIAYNGVRTVEVDGGSPGEQFTIGDGSENLDRLPTTVVIQGAGSDPQGHGDSLVINDKPNATNSFITSTAPLFTITGQSVTRTDPVTFVFDGAPGSATLKSEMDYSGIANVEVDGGASPNTFNVEGTAAGTSMTINAGSGGDTFNVGSPTNTLDPIQGAVSVVGQGANTTLNVHDDGTLASQDYAVYATSIHRFGVAAPYADNIAAIGYQQISSLNLYLGQAQSGLNADRVRNIAAVHSTAAGTTTTIFGGAGSNWVTVRPFDAQPRLPADNTGIQGAVSVHGGGNPVDVVQYYDFLNPQRQTYTLSATQISATDSAAVTFDDKVHYTGLFTSRQDGSTINLLSTAATTYSTGIQVEASDTVNVGSAANTLDPIQGAVTVTGASGNTTLNFNDKGGTPGAAPNQEYAYSLAQNTFSRTGTATVTFSGIATVNLDAANAGGSGFNALGVSSTAPGTTYNVYAGTGENLFLVFDINYTLKGIQGPLNLHGTGGFSPNDDAVFLNDVDKTTRHTFRVTAGATFQSGQVQRFADQTILNPDMAAINYDGLNAYSVLYTAGSAGATINVQGNAADLLTIVAAGTGDTVNVGNTSHTMAGISGDLRIQGTNPTVNLDDSGDASARTIDMASDGVDGYRLTGLLPSSLPPRGRLWLLLDPLAPVTLKTGTGDDVFRVHDFTGAPAISIDAEPATSTRSNMHNKLDYSLYVSNVTVEVDLPLQQATGFAKITHIQDVTGCQGNNLLVGDDNPNVLRGGTGRNIIIGGKGADQLFGGNLDNILIAGYTLFDQDPNLIGLRAIMKEWISGNPFATRAKNISNGVVGSDGKTYALIGGNGKTRTVFDDSGAVDVLTCTPNTNTSVLDWLFANIATDQIVNAKKKDFSYEVPLF